jgi:competence protein ComEC
MQKTVRKIVLPVLLLLGLTALIIGIVHLVSARSVSTERAGFLTVTFLDVGQGDATFIQSPNGTQMLIDGGRDASILRRLPEVMGTFDRTIDVVLATHPDSDHIAGLVDVLERYEVATIIMTDNMNDTPVYDAFMRSVHAEQAQIVLARSGQVFDLGRGEAGSTTLTILFPDRSVRDLESNASSIIAKLSYRDADVLLTGDAPDTIEEYLVTRYGDSLQSEVLKIGHHGSRTSTSQTFVATVRPALGIISAGKDNDYGHPHKEVLETLASFGVETKNTADVGSVFLESNGRSIWLR